MRSQISISVLASVTALLVFGAGCAQTISREDLAAKVSKSGGGPFSDQFLYVGDDDGYHYVRHRSIYTCWAFVGDSDYRISMADWEIAHPFPRTGNPRRWRNVAWMDGDTRGIPQNPFMYATPSFPEGAPATLPAINPARNEPQTPDTAPAQSRPADPSASSDPPVTIGVDCSLPRP